MREEHEALREATARRAGTPSPESGIRPAVRIKGNTIRAADQFFTVCRIERIPSVLLQRIHHTGGKTFFRQFFLLCAEAADFFIFF